MVCHGKKKEWEGWFSRDGRLAPLTLPMIPPGGQWLRPFRLNDVFLSGQQQAGRRGTGMEASLTENATEKS